MLKKDLMLRSPVSKTLGIENTTDGRLGAVLSRAGVGKTSFLVQIALTLLLRDEKILHISLNEQIDKINIRYHDGYTNLVDSIGYVDSQKAFRIWDDIQFNKVGISYTESAFDTVKIRDYLNSFKKADLPLPAIMVIDGLDFDTDVSQILNALEALTREFSLFTWVSIQSHREETLCDDGFPIQLEKYKDRFDKALFLKPVEDRIEAVILKDGDRIDQKCLLNPATMMIVEGH